MKQIFTFVYLQLVCVLNTYMKQNFTFVYLPVWILYLHEAEYDPGETAGDQDQACHHS